jgi:type IV fimbrial biogenesis protein FimT
MQVQPQQSDAFSSGVRRWRATRDQVLRRRHLRGFTLVELMITVAVAAVLLMIAVPSFRNITLSNRLNTAANDLVNAIAVARMEAIKRNAGTQFCSNSASANTNADTSDLGGACGTEAGAVWAMSGADPKPVLAGPASLVPPIQLSGDLTALRFSAQGQARKVGDASPYGDGKVVADICTSQMSRDNHRVITMKAGSILTTTPTSGDCPSS